MSEKVMFKKVIHYCDHCNKNQEGDGDEIVLEIWISHKNRRHNTKYEVCKNCSDIIFKLE